MIKERSNHCEVYEVDADKMERKIIISRDYPHLVILISSTQDRGDSATVKKLLDCEEIPNILAAEEYPDRMKHLPQSATEWIGPILFFSSTLISQNPHLIDITIGIISTYLSDIFFGNKSDNVAKFSIIRQEDEHKYTKIDYNGPVNGIDKVKDIVKQLK